MEFCWDFEISLSYLRFRHFQVRHIKVQLYCRSGWKKRHKSSSAVYNKIPTKFSLISKNWFWGIQHMPPIQTEPRPHSHSTRGQGSVWYWGLWVILEIQYQFSELKNNLINHRIQYTDTFQSENNPVANDVAVVVVIPPISSIT